MEERELICHVLKKWILFPELCSVAIPTLFVIIPHVRFSTEFAGSINAMDARLIVYQRQSKVSVEEVLTFNLPGRCSF